MQQEYLFGVAFYSVLVSQSLEFQLLSVTLKFLKFAGIITIARMTAANIKSTLAKQTVSINICYPGL